MISDVIIDWWFWRLGISGADRDDYSFDDDWFIGNNWSVIFDESDGFDVRVGRNLYSKARDGRSDQVWEWRLLFSDPELFSKLEHCAVLVGIVERGVARES